MISKTPMHVLAAAACGFSFPLYAHHSASVFETSTQIVVKGRIAEVKFANPHSSIFVDVVEPSGEHVRWAVENSGTLAMTRQRGFDDNRLRVGDPIEVCGYAPKADRAVEGSVGNKKAESIPTWWKGANKVLTGRLLILKSGPAEDWSRYGPLDACQALLGSR